MIKLQTTHKRRKMFLPGRIGKFARGGKPAWCGRLRPAGEREHCRILLAVLDHVDPLVMPLVVDEIGMTGDREALEH